MAFREVDVVEIREVLRGWLDGGGLRTIAERAGVDRKTARRYVEAAQAAGLVRDAGQAALCDELIGAVVERVRPARPNGHGAAWDALIVAGWSTTSSTGPWAFIRPYSSRSLTSSLGSAVFLLQRSCTTA